MTDDGFWADVEVEPVGEALFRAVLVLGLSRSADGEDPDPDSSCRRAPDRRGSTRGGAVRHQSHG